MAINKVWIKHLISEMHGYLRRSIMATEDKRKKK